MIITRTPFRISFAGGGSDFSPYYEQYGGAVLSVTINKYIYLSMHPLFKENEFLLKYSMTENVADVNEIQHKIIKTVFKKYKIKGVDFNSSADVPAGTGLASSSAFTVGLINLCNAYTDIYMNKDEIAKSACDIEINDLKSPIGKQDQYACSFGGLNFIEFQRNGMVDVEKLYLNIDTYNKLNKNLLMFYTGQSRNSNVILSEQKDNIKDKVNHLQKMATLAKDLKSELLNGNPSAMGEILNEGWQRKKELANGITNSFIDEAYETALSAGATGGKLLGAGGGGFLLFYAEEQTQNNVRNALKNLKEMDFKFENQGTSIIYYNKFNLYRNNQNE